MRTFEHILSVTLFGVGLGLATAHAFDGTRTPSDVTPPVGIAPPEAVPPGMGVAPARMAAFQAFQKGTQLLRDGNTNDAVKELEYAAVNGEPRAAWKLGRMYADGVGVKQNDVRAMEYFRDIANGYADEAPGTAEARFVANAFVSLGNYYRTGIPNSDVKPNAVHAYEMFRYAATFFGDPTAQYRLGRMYLDGQGTAKSPKQAARWLSLAANKKQYEAQAVFGAMLFKGEGVPRRGAEGLMWLTLARDSASPQETWITDLYNAAIKQATEDERAAVLPLLYRWLGR